MEQADLKGKPGIVATMAEIVVAAGGTNDFTGLNGKSATGESSVRAIGPL